MEEKQTTQYTVEDAVRVIAIYLRKSRHDSGDEDQDLEKHRNSLERRCKQMGWKYTIYQEVKSGDDIEHRPKMRELLSDVDKGKFDAVFVYAYDRLGRGGGGDVERIQLTLRNTETLLITENPYKIFDLNDQSDETMMDVHGFMAKMEFREIKKRLLQGRKDGLLDGNWTHANTPYGYKYNKEKKSLEPDPYQKEVFREIVNMLLNGESSTNVAWKLNKRNIPSPKGKEWRYNTITRMIKNDVYLGHIIGNKSEGTRGKSATKSSKPFRYVPKKDWVVVKNCHEPLITEKEKDQIIRGFDQNTTVRYNNKVHKFSNLVECGQCGKGITNKEKDSILYLDTCANCGNHSGKAELVEEVVEKSLLVLKDKLKEARVDDVEEQQKKYLHEMKTGLEKDLEKEMLAIDKIEEAFEAGMYDVQKAREKTEKRQQTQWDIENELRSVQKQIDAIDNNNTEDRLTKIDYLLEDMGKDKPEGEMNRLYKSMISNIVWYKPNRERAEVTVNFI